MRYSVDGAAAGAVGAGGSFTVQKGTVVVYATDARRQHRRLAPAHARRPHAARRTPTTARPSEEPTPRTTTEAVLLRKGGAGLLAPARPARALGHARRKTTVDLRPLALGKGTFQFVIKVTTGKKSKTVHQDPDDQEGLLDAHQRQRLRRLRRPRSR